MQDVLDGQNHQHDVLEEPKDHKKLLFVIFIVAILAAIAFAVYYFITAAPIREGESQQALQNTPLLKPAGPLKRIPEDAGGLAIPHQDKQVFETIEEASSTEASSTEEVAEEEVVEEKVVEEKVVEEKVTEEKVAEPAEQVTVLPEPETLVVPEPSEAEPAESSETEAEAEPAESSETEAEAEPAESSEPSYVGEKLEIIIPPTEPTASPEASPEEAAEPAPSPEASPEEVEEPAPSPEASSEEAAEPAPSPEASPEEAEENEDTASQNTDDNLQIDIPDSSTETQQSSASAEEPSSFSVQFAASNSSDSAEVIREDLSEGLASILSPYGLANGLIVGKAQLDGADIFRVQITTLPYDTAEEICAKVKEENLDCFVKAEK